MARDRPAAIVLDSSFLIAYHNTRDVHHAAAARAMVQLVAGQWGRALLLEYVFLEVVTVLRARRNHETAVAVGATLLQAKEVDFIPCSEFFLDALDTFQSQRSGSLSFVDAAIVALARNRANGCIASFDRDFAEVDGVYVKPE